MPLHLNNININNNFGSSKTDLEFKSIKYILQVKSFPN